MPEVKSPAIYTKILEFLKNEYGKGKSKMKDIERCEADLEVLAALLTLRLILRSLPPRRQHSDREIS